MIHTDGHITWFDSVRNPHDLFISTLNWHGTYSEAITMATTGSEASNRITRYSIITTDRLFWSKKWEIHCISYCSKVHSSEPSTTKFAVFNESVLNNFRRRNEQKKLFCILTSLRNVCSYTLEAFLFSSSRELSDGSSTEEFQLGTN